MVYIIRLYIAHLTFFFAKQLTNKLMMFLKYSIGRTISIVINVAESTKIVSYAVKIKSICDDD